MRRLKRWVVLVHLYLGVVLAALFVMWFATGIVLMYAPFPGFGADRDYAALPALDCTRCTATLEAVLAGIPERKPLTPVRMGMDEDRPVVRYASATGQLHVIGAEDLRPLPPLDVAGAARRAAARLRLPATTPWSAEVIARPDQWTVEKVIRDQLPLVRVQFADAAGTRGYVSVHGRELVTHSTRRERFFAWIGAIPHWLYPRLLREHVRWWVWTIVVIGALGTVMATAGVAVGAWQARWRARQRGDGRPLAFTPYRTWWMRWHHRIGLAFGVVTCTWIFSGMMSVTPFDWSPGDRPTAAERSAFAGRVLDDAVTTVPVRDAVTALLERSHGALREVEPRVVGGQLRWVGYDADGRALPIDAGLRDATLTPDDIATLVRGMRPDAAMAAVERLDREDAYYYTGMSGHRRALPVVRVRMNDADATTYYVDPARLDVVMRQVGRSRWERWLYHGLHDFDFATLTARRPLWDVVVIVLCLGGLALSVTGIVGAWRWTAPRLGVRAGARR